jgi:SRSO17 transposase
VSVVDGRTAAALADRPAPWQLPVLDEVGARIAGLFARREPHRQALQYLVGLLSDGKRKNSWQMAEVTGDDSPWRMQRLLNRARWDADAMRDVVVDYLGRYLGHQDGVLVIGEIGVLKKGTESVAVDRQYTDTTEQVENCQIGVIVTYASPLGRAIVDRELYLPASWTADPERCRKARVPEDRIRPLNKPELAKRMIHRMMTGRGLPFTWVSGDVTYGRDESLRTWLEAGRRRYALAVPASQTVITPFLGEASVASLAANIPAVGWERHRGVSGPDTYWARITVTLRGDGGANRSGLAKGFVRTLLIRHQFGRSRLRFYLVHAPEITTTSAMIAAIEAQRDGRECVRETQRQTGLDQYKVRNWTAWYRHITLVLLAQAAYLVSHTADIPDDRPRLLARAG